MIPFLATIEGNKDVKNYADYLFENAGGAVLKWILEGAKRVIAADYKLPVPRVVNEVIEEYKAANDWLGHFLEECCETDSEYVEKVARFIRSIVPFVCAPVNTLGAVPILCSYRKCWICPTP